MHAAVGADHANEDLTLRLGVLASFLAGPVRDGWGELHLRAHPEILTNGAADLLLVEHAAADLSAHDEAVHRVCGHVAGATSGNYGALVTGSKLPLEAPRRRLSSGETGVKLMIERDLLTGLLVFALLFTIFISGFCCLFSLQTPRKFEDGSKAQ